MSIQPENIQRLIKLCDQHCIMLMESISETHIRRYEQLTRLYQENGDKIKLRIEVHKWTRNGLQADIFDLRLSRGHFIAHERTSHFQATVKYAHPGELISQLLSCHLVFPGKASKNVLIYNRALVAYTEDEELKFQFSDELTTGEQSFIEAVIIRTYDDYGRISNDVLQIINKMAAKINVASCD
ncbi:hypothetical protein A6E01_20355 (plasmid) [Vibrio breoganii]|uniref:Uncharacterized protein n=1 Tax=Vibrio breoganii TaxID=553239 RepID=A0AAN0XZX7_9VIBR|nr:hypothetical protein [Vibrio breoganii]ANO35567.1 hypothetical protein A6E01_20355 [Vibrio breoganii]PML15830.1 hypothetical protein BCT84_07450 [Vibrio breoganii]